MYVAGYFDSHKGVKICFLTYGWVRQAIAALVTDGDFKMHTRG